MQLDDACLRIGNGKGVRGSSGIGGCMLLLSVWSWERLPVGRPEPYARLDWNDHGNPLRYPTWAYRWDVVSEMTDDVELMYGLYTEELDSLIPEQVNIVKPSLILESPLPCELMWKILPCCRWSGSHMVILLILPMSLTTSTRSVQRNELFGVCGAHSYAIGRLSITCHTV